MSKKRKVVVALITLVSVYLLLCLALYFFQDLLLFPGARRAQGPLNTVAGVRVENLESEDGSTTRIAVGTPSSGVKGVLLMFLGNGEDLRSGVYQAARFAAYGLETVVPEYPGYGESGGRPSHGSILAMADRAGALARRRAESQGCPLFVAGHSLGTFPALHLAAQGIGERLLLQSPPTTIAAAGQSRFPFLPVATLLRHPFDNLANAPRVRVPTLVLHGDRDRVVPPWMGATVAAAIPGAVLHRVPGKGHNDMDLGRHGPLGALIHEHLSR